MAFTNSQIAEDLGNIFSSLSETGANEEAILAPSSGAANTTFNVIRARTLTDRELQEVGWANRYQVSVYATEADGSTAAKGDIVTMETEGELRILRISRGPALGYVRLDLGDPYGGGV